MKAMEKKMFEFPKYLAIYKPDLSRPPLCSNTVDNLVNQMFTMNKFTMNKVWQPNLWLVIRDGSVIVDLTVATNYTEVLFKLYEV